MQSHLPLFRPYLLVAAVSILFCQELRAETDSRFHLYYGNDADELAKIDSTLADGSIVAIDSRAFTPGELAQRIRLVHRKQGRVISYFSIGELHSAEVERFKSLLLPSENWEDLVIDENETFHSFRIDVKHDAWKRWVAQEVKTLLASGIDGIFLDTVDTIDRYATRENWSLERRAESVAAMIALIRSIKQTHPKSYLMQNGGLNMVGKTMFVGAARGIDVQGQNLASRNPHHPDALLWENALAGKDPWTLGRQKIIEQIQEAGFTGVFALGYEEAHPDADGFFRKCREIGLVGSWAHSSLVLHEAATVADTSIGPSHQ